MLAVADPHQAPSPDKPDGGEVLAHAHTPDNLVFLTHNAWLLYLAELYQGEPASLLPPVAPEDGALCLS